MAIFVVDASAALAWCFEDEASTWTEGLLERLRQGDGIVVPAHWPTEVLNGLLVASRRKRIKPDQPALFWDELARLPIEAEPPLTAAQAVTALALAQKHSLTVYDAAYLELAQLWHAPRIFALREISRLSVNLAQTKGPKQCRSQPMQKLGSLSCFPIGKGELDGVD